MSRRVCSTVAGDSVCCTAAQRGLLNRVFTFTTRSGRTMCGECSTRQSTSKHHPGRLVFQFRFHKNAECGIGPRGCAALANMQGGGAAAPGGGGIGSFLTIPQGGVLGGSTVPQLALP
jgi:hypothetical protein